MYVTVADLKNYIKESLLDQLCDPEGNPPDVDGATGTAKCEKALEEASDLIDSYVMRKTTTPVSPVPAILQAHCADIALYRLYQHSNLSDEMNPRAASFRGALAWLRLFSEGKVHFKSGTDTFPESPRAKTNTEDTDAVVDSTILDEW